MHRGRRAARRRSGSGARSRLTLAEVGGGWWRCGRMVEAAPEQPPPTSTNLLQPTPTTHRRLLHDAGLDQIARSLRPPVPAPKRRDVQWDRRQVVEQDRPWGEHEHRRDTLHRNLEAEAYHQHAGLLG